MMNTRHIYISVAPIIAIALATPAASQSAAAPANVVAASEQGATEADASERNAPQEIVVTATKRNESLVKVPIQVSVFTEQAIVSEGIVRAPDFLASVPNVTFIEDNAGEAYVNIRGQTATRSSDPNVAFVIDGVLLSSVKGFQNQDLFDINQIEVLKGPQSAIYGRNAAAGAIVITTKRPGEELEGHALISGGNFDSYRGTAGISGPLAENLGASISGSYRHTDGSYTSIPSGEKVQRSTNFSGRGRLVYDDKDKLLIDFKVGGFKSFGGGSSLIAQIVGVPVGGFDGTKLDANNTDIPFLSPVPREFSERFMEASLKIEYNLGFATLTSITGVNDIKQYFGSQSPPYLPGVETIQQYTYRDKNKSQELRLTSPSDQRFRWQIGFYILRFDRDQTSNIMVNTDNTLPRDTRSLKPPTGRNASLSYDNPIYRTTNYAPFASIQFDATDQLHINLAGRYDTEKRSIRNATIDAINPLTGANYNNCVALTGKAIAQCTNSETFTQFQPKASISYDVTPSASVYSSFGRGFKSGGFNPIGSRQALQAAAVGAGINPNTVFVQDLYQKEVSTTYEVGAKARLFDRRLAINAAAFSTDITGAAQFQFFPSVGLQTTISIDKVRSRGFEVDMDWTFPNGLRVFGGYGYVDAKVINFSPDPSFNGNRAPGSFRYTFSAGATKEFDLGGDLSLVPRVEYNRYGSIWWDVNNTPGTQRAPIELVNARLTLKKGDRWQVSAYGDNIFNKRYYQEIVPLLGFFTVNYPAALRTYGIEARMDF
jgi:iron complex outermembrane receptor protein